MVRAASVCKSRTSKKTMPPSRNSTRLKAKSPSRTPWCRVFRQVSTLQKPDRPISIKPATVSQQLVDNLRQGVINTLRQELLGKIRREFKEENDAKWAKTFYEMNEPKNQVKELHELVKTMAAAKAIFLNLLREAFPPTVSGHQSSNTRKYSLQIPK